MFHLPFHTHSSTRTLSNACDKTQTGDRVGNLRQGPLATRASVGHKALLGRREARARVSAVLPLSLSPCKLASRVGACSLHSSLPSSHSLPIIAGGAPGAAGYPGARGDPGQPGNTGRPGRWTMKRELFVRVDAAVSVSLYFYLRVCLAMVSGPNQEGTRTRVHTRACMYVRTRSDNSKSVARVSLAEAFASSESTLSHSSRAPTLPFRPAPVSFFTANRNAKRLPASKCGLQVRRACVENAKSGIVLM